MGGKKGGKKIFRERPCRNAKYFRGHTFLDCAPPRKYLVLTIFIKMYTRSH